VCGDERIHAVIGGLHLKFSGPERAVALGAYLQEEAVERLFACHCTGSRKAGCCASARSGRVLSTVFRRKKNGNPKIAGRNVFDAI
jgi:metal-dependent hydrolase (beta-lactamase superfamily II)